MVMLVDIRTVESARKILKDRYPDMVRIFFDDTKSYIEEIDNAIVNRCFANAIRPAHTIKSSSLRMGALALSQHAYAMEMALKESDAKKFVNFDVSVFRENAAALRDIYEQTRCAFP